ncbi:DUF982 domain-containing protein [Rhizobium leguminosarum bv. viciae]|uniref:DUF982 domain-containing protein n=1 Tax=Rhizobium leguminosarum TaxID=384 RepID=UPI00103D7417|nr:DUF982 domain-containing protein [Rhizobium leguminosarum]TBY68956.1 DUF982 domain-containing protein [Rhizobium leguminosarum bv. viciae]
MPRLGLVDWRRSDDFAPLMLLMSGQEKSRLVRSLSDVAKALIVAWPTDDGKEYVEAVKSCLDAIHGNVPAKAAHAALIRAADEAGIPVIAVVH